MNSRERILAMIAGQAVDRLPLMPITMMFAADLAGVRYREYASDYRVLVAAQLRTAETFGFDHVSVISDPAREAGDCGATVHWFDDQPPAIDESRALLEEKTALLALRAPDPMQGKRMRDRIEAAALFKQRVGGELLIEGWIEGPCAEGADLRGINTLMLDCIDDQAFVNDLFAFVVELELNFARAQLAAGADLIGIGDAAASLVGPRIYRQLVWPHEKRLIDGIHAMGAPVRLHICGNTRALLSDIGRLGCEIVDLDYYAPVDQARAAMGDAQVLLGNMDPVRVLRDGDPSQVTAALAECHRQAGARYIAGAGCELARDTPHANVHALAAYCRSAPLY